jgi:ParB-like chromosome segregation protein Spo0J
VPRRSFSGRVKRGFEDNSRAIPIASIKPLKIVTAEIKATPRYRQIVASIHEVGIIEPPVVAHDRDGTGHFLLLDGRLRIEALKDLGHTEVVCLVPKTMRRSPITSALTGSRSSRNTE